MGGPRDLTGSGVVLESLLEVGELLGNRGDGVALNGDNAVAADFLGVLVDETTAEDADHFGLVEGAGFLESAGVLDAAVFRHAEKKVSGGVYFFRIHHTSKLTREAGCSWSTA